MKVYLCKVCGHVEFGPVQDKCAVCGAAQSSFEEKEGLIKSAGAIETGGESEKKHIPAITVVKTCGLIPEGCTDVHAKIGSLEHPMLPEHYITFIEFFLDKKFVARTYLMPELVHPAAALHLAKGQGELTVVEHCSVHGYWMASETL